MLGGLSSYANKPYYRQYEVSDGMPSNECYYVHQDALGYMWFCTDRGVARYDGSNFENMSTKSQLQDQTIFEVVENNQGDLLFSTISGRIYHYKQGNGVMTELNIPRWLQDDLNGQKTYLQFGQEGKIYLGMHYNGLYRFEIESPENIEKIPFRAKSNVHYIIEVDDDKFISSYYLPKIENLSSREKLQLVQTDTITTIKELQILWLDGTVTHFTAHIEMARHFDLRYFAKLSNHSMLVSMGNKVLLINQDGIVDELTYKNLVTAFYYNASDKLLYVASDKSDFQQYTIDNNKFQWKTSIFNNQFVTVPCTDMEGGLWVPSTNSGVFYFPHAGRVKQKAPKVLVENGLYDAKGFKQHQYFSLVNGSLFYINDEKISPLLSNSGHKVIYSKIGWVDENRVYMRSILLGEKYCFEQGSIKPIPIDFYNESNNHQFSTLIDGNSLIQFTDYNYAWFGDKRNMGLVKYNLIKKELTKSPQIFEVATMLSNICKWNNRYWWGHVEGLYSSDTLLQDIRKEEEIVFRVQYLAPDKDILWVATRNEGLISIHPDFTTNAYTVSDGLVSNLCNQVFVDEQRRVWVATSKGLNVLIRDTLEHEKYRVIDVGRRLGISKLTVKNVHVYGSRLWIYTSHEIFQANLHDVFLEPTETPMVISEVKVNQKINSPDSLNNLSYTSNYLDFSIQNLSYVSEEDPMYRYRLHGLNDNWVKTNHHTFTFTDLSPGKYTLEVQYLKSDHTWSQSNNLSSFSIIPAFWQRTDFRVLLILLLLALLYWFIHWRLGLSYSQKSMKLALVQARRKALVLQMNPHFIFNSLNSIQRFITLRENDQANHFLTHFASLMRKVISNSEQSYVPLIEEIEAIKTYLVLESQRFEPRLKYQIKVDEEVYPELLKISPLLVQPFVENAIWHGLMPKKAGGLLLVHFSIMNDCLKIIVEDNGLGREASKRNKELQGTFKLDHTSIGIKNSEERIRLTNELTNLHATLTIEDLYEVDGVAIGTRVVITYPIIKDINHENNNHR
jgi:ligand-binding sensor domain-containing protein